jgi:hypothetical protein
MGRSRPGFREIWMEGSEFLVGWGRRDENLDESGANSELKLWSRENGQQRQQCPASGIARVRVIARSGERCEDG